MASCSIRPCETAGAWRYYDKRIEDTYAVLRSDGTWARFHGPRWEYEPVEVVGPSPEALADYLQELRDQAPPLEGSSIYWSCVNSGIYMTLDRQWVMEVIVILHPRNLHPFQGPLEHHELFIGPLMNFKAVVLEYFNWFFDKHLRSN